MHLRLGQMRKTLQNFIHTHAQLVVAGDGPHRNAGSFNNGRTTRNARISDNVRIDCRFALHPFMIPRQRNQASNSLTGWYRCGALLRFLMFQVSSLDKLSFFVLAWNMSTWCRAPPPPRLRQPEREGNPNYCQQEVLSRKNGASHNYHKIKRLQHIITAVRDQGKTKTVNISLFFWGGFSREFQRWTSDFSRRFKMKGKTREQNLIHRPRRWHRPGPGGTRCGK